MIEDAEVFQVQDEAKQGSLKKKSELETYLYKVNKMLRKSDVKKSMPKEMRDALRGEIGDILDWIEANPEEKGEVYEKRMREFEKKAELKIAPFRVFDGRCGERSSMQTTSNRIWCSRMARLSIGWTRSVSVGRDLYRLD